MGSWATLVAGQRGEIKDLAVAPLLGRGREKAQIARPFCAFKGWGGMVRCAESFSYGAVGRRSIMGDNVDDGIFTF